MDWSDIRNNALVFSKRWKYATREEAEAQLFIHEFMEVFGVDSKRIGIFEFKVPHGNGRNGYIDMLWKGRILIEMKSRGKSLERAYKQARDYAFDIKSDEDLPEYIMVSDFEFIRLYKLTTNQEWTIETRNLSKNVRKFSILTERASKLDFFVNKELNVKAAYKMSELHDILKENGYLGNNLEVYLVRLLFCMFAEDTGIFNQDQFLQYIISSKEDGLDLSGKLSELFEVLNTPKILRQSFFSEQVKDFEYINGGLFAEVLRPAAFDKKTRDILIKCSKFNWADISPAIFGSMFQGVMNPEERSEYGAHYTSEQNILKVLKPLFLDELWEEFEQIKSNIKALERFHNKIASLKFLDPACGCGNFLIITYRELRKLELELLKMKIEKSDQRITSIILEEYIRVNVDQFYGIEYQEFPGQIAQVGLWIMDHQMNNYVAEEFGLPFKRLPLKTSAHIKYGSESGNALRINWEDVVSKNELSFIIGNPPFHGLALRTLDQQQDMKIVFKGMTQSGRLDYVTAWYEKASEYIMGTRIAVAFVSTNSITQGEQAPILWKRLLNERKMQINFAYRPFVWSNEAKGKAAVHCVIIGFAHYSYKQKYIYSQEKDKVLCKEAKNINGYLKDGESFFIQLRSRPSKEYPKLTQGNKPWDGGNLILSEQEKNELISKYPQCNKFIRQYIGSKEFINGLIRYCLWLVDINPNDYINISEIIERIEKVRDVRSKTKTNSVRKQVDIPMLFSQIRQPITDYILIPETSSSNRNYIPIGFMDKNIIASNSTLVAENANLYHFGILTSSVHMAWVRAIAGRLKSDYRYSPSVYNNFPWPSVTKDDISKIEEAAQLVIDTRKKYPKNTLAELYGVNMYLFHDLLLAHKQLDIEVCKSYGEKWKSEADCIKSLLNLYEQKNIK